VVKRCSCDPHRLRLLLEDSLPPEQRDQAVAHLDDCTDCQHALERLAADGPWWRELRQIPDLGETVPPLFRPRPAGAAGGEGPYLGFLDPCDEPGCLGRLGPFTVTALLGQGGTGVVLSAHDAVLDRAVAIKVLAPHFASSAAARQRFAREARAAAAVVHPHVVPIHSVDSWKGLPYLVMSRVAGVSLQDKISSAGPLPLAEVLRIGAQAAEGLAAAHAQGLVHRDVKPANILLEDQTGRVLLTDFGLARAADDASLTQSGVIAGTPHYMAPEQAAGEAVDHRADLFSLGSVLYAMCSGQSPFAAEGPLAVMRRVCDERPPPLRSLCPAVPAWLAAIIARLHARRPEDRFQSAAELADLLAGCLAHVQQPATVPLPPALYAIWRPSRARPVVLGLLVLLGLAVAGLFSWPGSPRPRRDELPAAAAARQPPAPRDLQEPLDRQFSETWQRLGALEADLHRPAGAAVDPVPDEMRKVRGRLDALERELSRPAR
jgi:serine/threonine-protein kinase